LMSCKHFQREVSVNKIEKMWPQTFSAHSFGRKHAIANVCSRKFWPKTAIIFYLYIRRGLEFWYPEKKGCPFLCSPILPKRTILRLSIEEKRSFSGIPSSFFVQLRQIFMRTWSSYSFCQLIFWCSLFFFCVLSKTFFSFNVRLFINF
jgi:hypothetical protein